jgi:phospholipase C
VKRVAAVCVLLFFTAALTVATPAAGWDPDTATTATPIKHLVVLYDENVSFDHYFATYPVAANPPGEPRFTTTGVTAAVNTLLSAQVLANNPNFTQPANGADAAEPFRLDRTQASTADQNHAYTAEQQAYDGGKADRFPRYTGNATPGGVGAFGTRGQVMGYFDGNTVTALWRYAQRYALDDNAYADAYGPSTPGAIEVVSGQTNGMLLLKTTQKPSTMLFPSYYINDGQRGYTMMGDVDPAGDVCSSPTDQVQLTGRNIGDLLDDAGISWGGFMGGFDLTTTNANGTTGCRRTTHSPVVGTEIADYIAHHNWFAYYVSTANPTHARPSSIAAVGHTLEADGTTRDPANHEYDLHDFYAALNAGNFPAVSFLKSPGFRDGHAGYSDPLDEQSAIVALVNFLQAQPDWKNTAIVLAWDDSDGWYDHAAAAVTQASYDVADQLDRPAVCGAGSAPPGLAGKPVNGRCGPGPRLPFLVISPWARPGFVSHQRITQSSVVRFIEDNWLHGKRLGGGSFDATAGSIASLFDFTATKPTPPLVLDPTTGNAPPPTPSPARTAVPR